MTARQLEGRVALVTGAGHGIGLAIATKLGGAGASVVVNDLTRDVADGAVAAVEAAGGRHAIPLGLTKTAELSPH